MAYFLAIKSSGELVRQEVELHITEEHFYALAEMVSRPFITKDSYYKMKNFWKRTRI